MICCILNISNPLSKTSLDTTATTLSFVFMGVLIVGFIIIAILTMFFKTLGVISREKFFFLKMFTDLDTTVASRFFYYVFYLLKRTVFAFSFATLYDEGLVPMNLIYVFTIFLPLLYLSFVRPFTHRLTNIHMIYNEFNELFIITLYYYYYDPWLTDWQFYEYARITVIDIAVWVIISYIIFLLSLPRYVRLNCCPPRKPKIYLPEYEEEIMQIIDSPISSEKDYVIPAAAVKVTEFKRNFSISSDDKDSKKRQVMDDDLDGELDELERDPNAQL